MLRTLLPPPTPEEFDEDVDECSVVADATDRRCQQHAGSAAEFAPAAACNTAGDGPASSRSGRAAVADDTDMDMERAKRIESSDAWTIPPTPTDDDGRAQLPLPLVAKCGGFSSVFINGGNNEGGGFECLGCFCYPPLNNRYLRKQANKRGFQNGSAPRKRSQ